MTFDEYQLLAEQTAVFQNEFYPYASLLIESSEFVDLFVKPMLRGDNKIVEEKDIISEAGDILWNLSVILKRNNIKLSSVAEYNIAKLKSRQERGVLMGDGGDR